VTLPTILRENPVARGLQWVMALALGAGVCLGAWGQDMAANDQDQAAAQFEPFADVRLRGDFVRDLPRPVDKDFDRGIFRARPGVRWLPDDALEFGAALRINLGTDGNGKTRFNVDNEKADDAGLDQAYLLAHLGADTDLLVGQTTFPLWLSPMVWDPDLRPQGVSVRHGIPVGDFSSLELLGGVFLGNHLYGDKSRIRAAQAIFNLNEGTPLAWRFSLAWLDFSELDKLADEGLARTNRVALETYAGEYGPTATYANEYSLADVRAGVTLNKFGFPVRLQLDAVRNVSVGSDGFGFRADLILGDSRRRHGPEVGGSWQRVQREAVVAAFANDDWWFHTRMRGTMLWAAYGITDSLRVQLSGFAERLDVASDHNWRALIDVEWTYK
jgi:hypothetical protein